MDGEIQTDALSKHSPTPSPVLYPRALFLISVLQNTSKPVGLENGNTQQCTWGRINALLWMYSRQLENNRSHRTISKILLGQDFIYRGGRNLVTFCSVKPANVFCSVIHSSVAKLSSCFFWWSFLHFAFLGWLTTEQQKIWGNWERERVYVR